MMLEQVCSDYVYLRVTGDAPVDQPEESEVDKIETYRSVISALQDARDTLVVMNDSQGRSINRQRAVRCRVAADRCARALDDLQKVAEL
jgi:hypothetical protein